MEYILNSNHDLIIRKPFNENEDILNLIKKLSDQSDNFPFNSEDFGLEAKNLGTFVEYINMRENSIFYVAQFEEKIVGLAYLEGGKRARTAHCANFGIGVLGEFNDMGIGTILINEIVKFASQGESIAKIDLQVKLDNIKAISLYKKCGFVPEGKISRALFINGEFYDYLSMGLIID